MSNAPTPAPARSAQALRRLILNEGSELVYSYEGADAGIFLLGESVFVVAPGEEVLPLRYPDLPTALDAEAELIAAAHGERVYRWSGSAVTLTADGLMDVCPAEEWISLHGEPVFSAESTGFMSSYWAVMAWHDYYFIAEDDGVIPDALDHPADSWEEAWRYAVGGKLRVHAENIVETGMMDQDEFVQAFRVWGREPAKVTFNGVEVTLRPDSPEDADGWEGGRP